MSTVNKKTQNLCDAAIPEITIQDAIDGNYDVVLWDCPDPGDCDCDEPTGVMGLLNFQDFTNILATSGLAATTLSLDNIFDSIADLSWTTVADATDYEMQYKKCSDTVWSSAGSVSAPTITGSVPSLMLNTCYDFRILATDGSRQSTSNTVQGTTTCISPSSVNSLSLSSQNSIAPASITASWNTTGTPDYYEYSVSNDGISWSSSFRT